MTLDLYGVLVAVERLVALALILAMTWRARRHEPEAFFDYRRRAVFAYSINAMLMGSLVLSAVNVALPGSDVFPSRVAIAVGTAATIVGYGLMLLGWPGPRRNDR